MQKYCRKYKKTRAPWTLYNIVNSDGLEFFWTHPETLFTFTKVTRGRKRLQMLSDVISKSYEDLKREVEDRSWWKKRAS